MDFENDVVDFLVEFLQNQFDETTALSNLERALLDISSDVRSKIKSCGGFIEFLLKHPEAFVVVDDLVILVHGHIEARKAENRLSALPEAVRNIIKDLQASGECMVCSDKIEVYAFGTCFHPICFKCDTKLRILCGDLKCTVCRKELKQVLYTTNLEPIPLQDLNTAEKDEKFGIVFHTQLIKDAHVKLLSHSCPKCPSTMFKSLDSLAQHLRMKHNLLYCPICLQHKKYFTEERELFTPAELKKHEEAGDSNKTSGRGHPLCQFCKKRFLDNDELYGHLKRYHFSCHLCDATQSEGFYDTIAALWDHSLREHYPCRLEGCYHDPSCVFPTDIALQGHMHQEHGGARPLSSINFGTYVSSSGGNSSSSRIQQFSSSFLSGNSELAEFTGTVNMVVSFYGFIQIDSSEDCVYFNAGALGLRNLDDDLSLHIKPGTRCRVWAKTNSGNGSKWRAERLQVVDDGFRLPHHPSASSQSATDGLSLNSINSFPSLSSATSDNLASVPSTSQPAAQWKKVTNNTYKKPTTASSSSSSQSAGQAKFLAPDHDIPGEGYAYVLQSTNEKFGFLRAVSVPVNQPDRNIYFDYYSYAKGVNKTFAQVQSVSLNKIFKVNETVFYRLQVYNSKKNAACKYKADMVLKKELYDKMLAAENLKHKKKSNNQQASSCSSMPPPSLIPPKRLATTVWENSNGHQQASRPVTPSSRVSSPLHRTSTTLSELSSNRDASEKLDDFDSASTTTTDSEIQKPADDVVKQQEHLPKKRINQKRLDKEKLRKEKQEQIKKEKLKQEQLEKEKIKKEKLKQEQLEKERLKKEKIEKERQEQIKKEKLKQEQLEKEKLQKEKIEKERQEQIKKEKLKQEQLEKERLQKEKIEKERQEQIKKEKLKQEQLVKERLQKEKIEKERQEQIKKEKIKQEQLKKDKLQKEKIEKERQEQIKKEKLDKEQLGKERRHQERLEKERIMKEVEQKKLKQEQLEKENIQRQILAQLNQQKNGLDHEIVECKPTKTCFIDQPFKKLCEAVMFAQNQEQISSFMFDLELELSSYEGISGLLFISFEDKRPVTVYAGRHNKHGVTQRPLIIPLENYFGINIYALSFLVKTKQMTVLDGFHCIFPHTSHYITIQRHNNEFVFKCTLHFSQPLQLQ